MCQVLVDINFLALDWTWFFERNILTRQKFSEIFPSESMSTYPFEILFFPLLILIGILFVNEEYHALSWTSNSISIQVILPSVCSRQPNYGFHE